MRTSIVARVVVTLVSATAAFGHNVQEALPSNLLPADELPPIPAMTSIPEMIGDDNYHKLDMRQNNVANQAPTQAAVQYPSITTNWEQTVLGGQTTYVPIVYTQTFAAVPDQWGGPVPGTIGYGTLTKNKGKRDAAPEPTGNVFGIAGRFRT